MSFKSSTCRCGHADRDHILHGAYIFGWLGECRRCDGKLVRRVGSVAIRRRLCERFDEDDSLAENL